MKPDQRGARGGVTQITAAHIKHLKMADMITLNKKWKLLFLIDFLFSFFCIFSFQNTNQLHVPAENKSGAGGEAAPDGERTFYGFNAVAAFLIF